jgi:GAF domain-containing protein
VTQERPDVDPALYSEARSAIRAQLAASVNEIGAHELVCEELYQRFEHYSWVGIYVVEGDELVLSAWAGEEETEHTTIKVGEGICGMAAATGRTEIVPDVSEREEFIACFPSTRSEIVVPITGPEGVLGEIDIDSDWLDAFDDRDRELLEDVAARVSRVMIGGM